jgi:3-methyladenine DNA glycosylase/8-oxoguanine DNA glycosylase
VSEPKRRRVSVGAPYDLAATLRPWPVGGGDPTMRIEAGAIAKAARLSSGPVTIRFVEAGDGAIDVEAWGDGASEALERAPQMLGADDEPRGFRPSEPTLAELAARFPGLRIGRAPSLMEVLITTIVQQRVTTAEAIDSLRALGQKHPEAAPGPLGLSLPVAPRTLAEAPYYTLHPLGIEKRRADVLRYVCARPKRIGALADLDRPEALRRLRSISGIGPWTAGLVAGIALGDPDAVPTGDYHLPSYVAWALAGEPRADDARMLELLAPYEGHRWRVIRLIRLAGIRAPRFGPRKGPAHWNRRRK